MPAEQLVAGDEHVAFGRPDRAGREVETAGRVEDRAAHPQRRPAGEGHTALGVVADGRLDEPEPGGLRELLAVGVPGVVGGDPSEHLLHQREVVLHEDALRVRECPHTSGLGTPSSSSR